jgi:hypothetical protein
VLLRKLETLRVVDLQERRRILRDALDRAWLGQGGGHAAKLAAGALVAIHDLAALDISHAYSKSTVDDQVDCRYGLAGPMNVCAGRTRYRLCALGDFKQSVLAQPACAGMQS